MSYILLRLFENSEVCYILLISCLSLLVLHDMECLTMTTIFNCLSSSHPVHLFLQTFTVKGSEAVSLHQEQTLTVIAFQRAAMLRGVARIGEL